MPPAQQFFDMSADVTPPGGYMQPIPLSLGPNRQPNDVRLVFITCSGGSGGSSLEMKMTPSTPTGFTAAYAFNPTYETHAVYYRRLASSDSDNVTVSFAKPSTWQHFMLGMVTVRGMSPTSNPTGGWLKLNQAAGDSTASAPSIPVPGAGVMLLMAGAVQTPWGGSAIPSWAVSLGAPTGWTNLVATDKSGSTFYQYSNDPSMLIVAKTFSASGSTGTLTFPTAVGSPAFAGLYVFCPATTDISVPLSLA